jgi:hypothetical protein
MTQRQPECGECARWAMDGSPGNKLHVTTFYADTLAQLEGLVLWVGRFVFHTFRTTFVN